MSPAHRDLGAPIAYLVLETGTPVYAAGGEHVGTVREVFATPENDIFDALVLDTADGERYLPAGEVDRLYERGVVLRIGADEVARLSEPPGR